MAKGGDNVLPGTPFFEPSDVPCFMCDDIPCVPVCPSGALDIKSVLNEKDELDITKARMGLAVVHKESCVAFWGIQCDACYRACPLLDEAITLEYQKNDRTGKHGFLIPWFVPLLIILGTRGGGASLWKKGPWFFTRKKNLGLFLVASQIKETNFQTKGKGPGRTNLLV